MNKQYPHFEGKNVMEHLKRAREKGFLASREVHGAELSGFVSSLTDTLREISVLMLLLYFITKGSLPITFYIVLGVSLALWKAGRSAFLGWSRMERLHRLIEEERYEIEHNRQQEKEELKEMYRAKGLSEKLVNDIADSLCSDDNRLLQVMLEEEMGLTLEVYEHPLSQAFGALIGTLFASFVFILSHSKIDNLYFIALPSLLVGFSSWFYAKKERNAPLPAVVWMFAIGFSSISLGFFLSRIII